MKPTQSLDWVKQGLDHQTHHVDPKSQKKLYAFREHLFNSKIKKKNSRYFRWYASGATLASLVLITFSLTAPDPTIFQQSSIEDIDLLASNNEPVFYQDLEFYQWLESENNNDIHY
ncbi:MAG: hypothetical protein KAH22_01310 [Thiotrichaceae bacterium]|nr:hypothetical protein [Thiotrichaceae bacterium]